MNSWFTQQLCGDYDNCTMCTSVQHTQLWVEDDAHCGCLVEWHCWIVEAVVDILKCNTLTPTILIHYQLTKHHYTLIDKPSACSCNTAKHGMWQQRGLQHCTNRVGLLQTLHHNVQQHSIRHHFNNCISSGFCSQVVYLQLPRKTAYRSTAKNNTSDTLAPVDGFKVFSVSDT